MVRHLIWVFVFASCVLARAEEGPLLQLDTGANRGSIKDLVFTEDGKFLVSAGLDKVIRIWNWREGRTLRTIRGQAGPALEGSIYTISISPNNKWMAVGGWMHPECVGRCGDIRIYDFASGEPQALLQGHTDVVGSLTFSRGGKWLLSGSNDRSAILWEVGSWQARLRFLGHSRFIYRVAISPDSKTTITAANDGVRLWSISSGAQINSINPHTNVDERTVAVRSSDGLIATGDSTGEITLIDGHSGQFLGKFASQGAFIGQLVFTRDGRRLLSTCHYQGCRDTQWVWDVATGRNVAQYHGHSNIVTAAAISPDDKIVATAGGDPNEIHLWDLETGKLVGRLSGSGRTVWEAAFSANGDRVAWGHKYVDRKVGDTTALEEQLILPKPGYALTGPETMPIERTKTQTWKSSLIDLAGLELAYQLMPSRQYQRRTLAVLFHGKPLTFITRGEADGYFHSTFTFTPDGETVISGGWAGVIIAYDLKGKILGRFIGHQGEIRSLAPSSDGRYLLSSSNDQTIRLWNRQTREQIVSIFHGTDGRWVVWTPQGYYTGSPGADNVVGWQINRGYDKAADYVTAEQLRDYLYRPDIVDRAIILGSAEEAVREAKGTDRRLEDLLAIERPRFAFSAPERASGGSASLTLSLEATADPAKDIAISVNGTNIPFDKKAVLASAGKGPQTIQLPLFRGKNLIRVSAKNKGGETSKTLEIVHDGEGVLDRRGRLYVLAIRVSAYPGLGSVCGDDHKSPCDLPYSGQNAKEFAEFAAARLGPAYQNAPVVRVMVNGSGGDLEPTAANIEKQLKLFEQAQANDTVALFISGHGGSDDRDKSGVYRFFGSDTRFAADSQDFEPRSFVPWTEIDDALNGAYGRKLLFVDTCFSSGAYYKGFGGRAFYANEVAYLSAGPNQKGLWHADFGGSLFARAAVDGFNDGAKAPVTTGTLADYMKGHLQELLGDLKRSRQLASDVSQDLQYVFGRDAQDFVLASQK